MLILRAMFILAIRARQAQRRGTNQETATARVHQVGSGCFDLVIEANLPAPAPLSRCNRLGKC